MGPIFFFVREPIEGIVLVIYLRIAASSGDLGTDLLSIPKLVTFFGKRYANFHLLILIRKR